MLKAGLELNGGNSGSPHPNELAHSKNLFFFGGGGEVAVVVLPHHINLEPLTFSSRVHRSKVCYTEAIMPLQ